MTRSGAAAATRDFSHLPAARSIRFAQHNSAHDVQVIRDRDG
jgi:hypothetical protein